MSFSQLHKEGSISIEGMKRRYFKLKYDQPRYKIFKKFAPVATTIGCKMFRTTTHYFLLTGYGQAWK